MMVIIIGSHWHTYLPFCKSFYINHFLFIIGLPIIKLINQMFSLAKKFCTYFKHVDTTKRTDNITGDATAT